MDRSAEMIEDCTKADGGKGNTPEPDHAVEEVLFQMIIFFSIDRPRNDETGKNKKNDNIVLTILRTNTAEVSAKEPIKIGMAEEHGEGCGKP